MKESKEGEKNHFVFSYQGPPGEPGAVGEKVGVTEIKLLT